MEVDYASTIERIDDWSSHNAKTAEENAGLIRSRLWRCVEEAR
jgi:hypothetical protein